MDRWAAWCSHAQMPDPHSRVRRMDSNGQGFSFWEGCTEPSAPKYRRKRSDLVEGAGPNAISAPPPPGTLRARAHPMPARAYLS